MRNSFLFFEEVDSESVWFAANDLRGLQPRGHADRLLSGSVVSARREARGRLAHHHLVGGDEVGRAPLRGIGDRVPPARHRRPPLLGGVVDVGGDGRCRVERGGLDEDGRAGLVDGAEHDVLVGDQVVGGDDGVVDLRFEGGVVGDRLRGPCPQQSREHDHLHGVPFLDWLQSADCSNRSSGSLPSPVLQGAICNTGDLHYNRITLADTNAYVNIPLGEGKKVQYK